jgi:hypothetical protein
VLEILGLIHALILLVELEALKNLNALSEVENTRLPFLYTPLQWNNSWQSQMRESLCRQSPHGLNQS